MAAPFISSVPLIIDMKFLFLLSICLILILPAAADASGELGLSVSPQIFELDVFPGETFDKEISLRNLSEVALPVAVRTTDFTAKEDSGEMEFDEMSQDAAIASRKWFVIENPNLILEPAEKREIRFSINIPGDAEPGGHYSVMLFEPQLPSFYFKPGQPRTIPVVGVLFLFSVKTFALEPELEEKLEVVEFSLLKKERIAVLESFFRLVSRSFSRGLASINPAYAAEPSEIQIAGKAPSSFVLRIKNNDIYHIKTYGKISIYNIFGQKVGETEVLQKTILPGKTRAFPVELSLEMPAYLKWLPVSLANFLVQNLFFGRYQAKLELKAKTPLVAEIFRPAAPFVLNFFSLSWHFWLPFILIFSILIFLTVKYRKRIKLALKALWTKN